MTVITKELQCKLTMKRTQNTTQKTKDCATPTTLITRVAQEWFLLY